MISTDFANSADSTVPELPPVTTDLPAIPDTSDENGTPVIATAHADPDGSLLLTTDSQVDTDGNTPPIPTSATLAATADPTGHVGIIVPPEGNADYVTRDELKELLDQAYLRGRNEAVRATIIADTTSEPFSHSTPAMAADVAQLFAGRPSVWDDK